MMRPWFKLRYGLLAVPVVLGAAGLWAWAQESNPPAATPTPSQLAPLVTPAPVTETPAPVPAAPVPVAPTTAEAPAPDGAQRGVEVLTRGPIHEAFASLAVEPQPTPTVAKKPPPPIEEVPPAEKPEGAVIWIKGYWAYDDDRKDYLWVSGVWRTPPPGKQWVPGYWREEGDKAQWVPGFWTAVVKEGEKREVTYLPEPPKPPEAKLPDTPPAPDTFYVPGHWVWNGERYLWEAGYWAKVQPDYVWVPGHYRWTPGGYLYVAGYWDLAVSRRGVLYAPVVIDPRVVTVSYVYTPAYAVPETVVVDTLWVRPAYCHYYFGDYYGEEYRVCGYESCVVYSRRHYDSIIVYERYEHRRDPDWFEVRVRVYDERERFPERRPPRTLVQQNIVVKQNINVTNNYYMVAPTAQVAAAKGQKVVPVDSDCRAQALQQAKAVQQVSVQRTQTEVKVTPGTALKPRVASLSVPAAQPVASKPAAVTAPATTATHPTTAVSPAATAPVTGVTKTATPTTTPTHPAAPTAPATTVTTTTPATHPTTPAATGVTKGAESATQPAASVPAVKPAPSTGFAQTGTTASPATKPAADPGKPGVPGATQPLHPQPPPKQPPPPPPPPKRPPPSDRDKDKDKDKSRQQ
jgi:hypothetical protein